LNNNYITQKELKDKIIYFINSYKALNNKIVDIYKKMKIKKSLELKERINSKLKEDDLLIQKIIKTDSKIKKYATINCSINEKIISPIIKIKQDELNISKNIFGINLDKNEIAMYKDKLKQKAYEENHMLNLLILLIKNIIEHYGNISNVIYPNCKTSSKLLRLIFTKYDIKEKMESNLNLDSININNLRVLDKDFLNKFKIIREVEEEKEYDTSEEDTDIDAINKILIEDFPEKYSIGNRFIHKKKNEYFFGEYEIKAQLCDNKLFLILNNDEKYTLQDFVKLYLNKKNLSNFKDEHIYGIETSGDTDKSEKIKEHMKNIPKEDEENYDINLGRKERRTKRRISFEDDE
jgi:hypothetical protein